MSIYNMGVPQERQGEQNRVMIPQMDALSLKYFPQEFLNACDPYVAILGDCGTSRRLALAGRNRSLGWALIEYLKAKVLRIMSNTTSAQYNIILIMILKLKSPYLRGWREDSVVKRTGCFFQRIWGSTESQHPHVGTQNHLKPQFQGI